MKSKIIIEIFIFRRIITGSSDKPDKYYDRFFVINMNEY